MGVGCRGLHTVTKAEAAKTGTEKGSGQKTLKEKCNNNALSVVKL